MEGRLRKVNSGSSNASVVLWNVKPILLLRAEATSILV